MATKFPYASGLKEFFEKIREVSVPPKATQRWLETIGFKTSTANRILIVLKFIGFIDDSNVPSKHWQQYRGSDNQNIMAIVIKNAYSDLYDVYPEAHKVDKTGLNNFFSTQSTVGKETISHKETISRIVRTFVTLCELADLRSEAETNKTVSSRTTSDNNPVEEADSSQLLNNFSPTLHIDIQIHISPESTPEQVDQIFASMAKHLYNKNE